MEEIKSLLGRVLAMLERIEARLKTRENPGEGILVMNEKTLGLLKEYERRGLMEFIQKHGLPPRAFDECPYCWEQNKLSKGSPVARDEFKRSVAVTYEGTCGHRWVAQIKKG